jgi:hypothetical protein
MFKNNSGILAFGNFVTIVMKRCCRPLIIDIQSDKLTDRREQINPKCNIDRIYGK